jgi:hypothetical protein
MVMSLVSIISKEAIMILKHKIMLKNFFMTL